MRCGLPIMERSAADSTGSGRKGKEGFGTAGVSPGPCRATWSSPGRVATTASPWRCSAGLGLTDPIGLQGLALQPLEVQALWRPIAAAGVSARCNPGRRKQNHAEHY